MNLLLRLGQEVVGDDAKTENDEQVQIALRREAVAFSVRLDTFPGSAHEEDHRIENEHVQSRG